MPKLKHDWAPLQTYLNAHERVLHTYAKFMDYPKVYEHRWLTSSYLTLKCVDIFFTTYNGNKVRVDIRKDVEVDDSNPKRKFARTFGYSFNANQPTFGNLIRYDSPDLPEERGPYTPAHHYHHHKHIWVREKEEILLIPDDEWPHVDEFFREVLEGF